MISTRNILKKWRNSKRKYFQHSLAGPGDTNNLAEHKASGMKREELNRYGKNTQEFRKGHKEFQVKILPRAGKSYPAFLQVLI